MATARDRANQKSAWRAAPAVVFAVSVAAVVGWGLMSAIHQEEAIGVWCGSATIRGDVLYGWPVSVSVPAERGAGALSAPSEWYEVSWQKEPVHYRYPGGTSFKVATDRLNQSVIAVMTVATVAVFFWLGNRMFRGQFSLRTLLIASTVVPALVLVPEAVHTAVSRGIAVIATISVALQSIVFLCCRSLLIVQSVGRSCGARLSSRSGAHDAAAQAAAVVDQAASVPRGLSAGGAASYNPQV